MTIKYVDLAKQYKFERKEILPIIDKTLATGKYIGGDNVQKFEKNISKLLKVRYCIALNSGTDALTLGLHVLGVRKGDEVITTPNSFIASTAVIVHLGAKPVFVDVLPDQTMDPRLLKTAITKKTKAIMPVHLTGRVSEMYEINDIAKKRYKIFPTKYLVKDKFDNLSKIEKLTSPLLIISGKKDEIVPHEHSIKLFDKAKVIKESVFIDEAIHNNLYDFGIEKEVIGFNLKLWK